MQHAPSTPIAANQVIALYADRARSFRLAKGATFADLADHLDQPHIDGWHDDMPMAIHLRFAVAPQWSALLRAGI
jgi:hypothetical protein